MLGEGGVLVLPGVFGELGMSEGLGWDSKTCSLDTVQILNSSVVGH